MRRAEIPIANLLPIEHSVRLQRVAAIAARLQAGLEIADVPVVPYTESGSSYVAFDGHHSAMAAHLTGKTAVFGLVFESDQDLQGPYVDWLPCGITTLPGLRTYYEERATRLKCLGVNSMLDIPLEPSV